MSPELIFDGQSHEYFLRNGGEETSPLFPVPSVTQIIQGNNLYGYTKNEFAVTAMAKGRHVHKITELYDLHLMTQSDVDGEEVGYLDAFTKFIQENKYQPVLIESKMYHPKFLYAGTIDRLCSMHYHGKDIHAVIDIKTGMPNPATDLQLAGYADMAKANGYAVDHAFALHLQDDGRYVLMPQREPDRSLQVFLAALTLYRWRKSNGRIG